MSVKEEIAPVSASQTAAPPSLLDEIMTQTRVQPKSESYDITRPGRERLYCRHVTGRQ